MGITIKGEEVFDNTICANPPGPPGPPAWHFHVLENINEMRPQIVEVDVFSMSMFAPKQLS